MAEQADLNGMKNKFGVILVLFILVVIITQVFKRNEVIHHTQNQMIGSNSDLDGDELTVTGLQFYRISNHTTLRFDATAIYGVQATKNYLDPLVDRNSQNTAAFRMNTGDYRSTGHVEYAISGDWTGTLSFDMQYVPRNPSSIVINNIRTTVPLQMNNYKVNGSPQLDLLYIIA